MKLQRKDTAIYTYVKDVRKILKVMTNIFFEAFDEYFYLVFSKKRNN